MASSVDIGTPVALQGVAAPGYSALDVRRLAQAPAQEGVLTPSTDYLPGAGVAAKTITVAAGEALVQGDSVTNQGRYYHRNSATQTLDLATAPDATNPRIDQVVLEVKDDAHDASGLNVGRLRVISGTPSSGATLTNRTGAAALPSSCMRIADVLVPAGYNAAFVPATHIRDRRQAAFGAFGRRVDSAGLNLNVNLGATTVKPAVAMRHECSGRPILLTCRFGRVYVGASPPNYGVRLQVLVDGVSVVPYGYFAYPGRNSLATDINPLPWSTYRMLYVPTAGSHLFELGYYVDNSNVASQTTDGDNELIVEERAASDSYYSATS